LKIARVEETNVKILYLVTNDWYFWSHRLALARAARDAGAEVLVMTRLNAHRAALASEGFRVIPWRFVSPRGVNPIREALALWEVFVAYRRFRPDLVHHIALKPALYGGLAALFLGRIPSSQTIAGLGYLFTDPPQKIFWLRWLLVVSLWILQRCGRLKTIFQNPDDRNFFTSRAIVRAKDTVLIRGSGVNLDTFLPLPEPSGLPVVALLARMLWDKGIGEFVEAAQQLRRRGVKARFVLAGRVDHSPGSVREEQLESWNSSGVVEWWGYSEDVRAVLAQSNLVCLPSYYREGLPKILLEASACERAVVTTNSPGCREAVREGENGVLIPPRDTSALVNAIRKLLEDPALRARMGKRGREIVEQEFSERLVIQQTFALYREVLNGLWPPSNSAFPKENTEVLSEA
jgi:glycosyltransferase involved in cell wall biosynthesis